MRAFKFSRLLCLFALILASLLCLASCEGLLDTDDDGSEYEGKSYTVTFDSTGGTDVAAQTVTRGSYASEPTAPTRVGYVFRGWYYGSLKWSFDSYKVNQDVTLEARWAESTVQYTVSFDINCNASVIEEQYPAPAAQSVYEGQPATAPSNPRRNDGYRFEGWYMGAYEYDFESTVTADITLTAKWVKKPDNLIYDRETEVYIVIPDPTDNELWTTVQSNKVGEAVAVIDAFSDNDIRFIKDNEVSPQEHEIVFGLCNRNEQRTISVTAYELLLENELAVSYREEGDAAFLIYCDGSSIAVAYDYVEGNVDVAAIAAIDYFLKYIHKYEVVSSGGVMYVGRVDLPAD